jgi:PAS domain S-box-containing protein
MQVKRKLQINVAASVMAAAIIIAMLVMAVNSILSAAEASNIADDVVSSIYQRSEFRNDYIRSTNERARAQWYVKHEQIARLLKSASEKFRDAEDKTVLERMIKDQRSIGILFSDIVKNRERPRSDTALSQAIEDRLTNQLTMRRHNAILDARRLQESADKHLFLSLKLAGGGIICVLVVLTMAAIINSWAMGRIIADRVGRLRDGAAIIGEGNLDHRIDIKGNDEFAELSETFNAMTEKLRGSYVSLEKEIDERVKVGQELQRMATLLEETQSVARVGGWEVDLEKNKLYWTDETYRIHETSPSEYTPTVESAIAFYAPESIPIISSAVMEAIEQGKEFHLELQLVTAKGRLIWVDTAGKAIRREGRVVKVIGAFKDITERKRAEALRQSSAYHRSLLEASLDPLVTIDDNGKITDVNAATEKVTGLSREELIGTDFFDYFSEPENARAGYQRVFREGQVRDYALDIRHKDGHLTPVLYNASVYRDEAGKVVGVFAAARDITERKRAEDEIRKLNTELETRVIERTTELESSNKELEAFSYSVSHDLRSPLRSIEGFSHALLEDYAGTLDDRGKDYLNRVRNATMRMGHLIDDLLKLSRVTRSEMNRERVDLSLIARTIADDLKNRHPKRPAQFNIHEGLTAYCDARLMTVAMENMLSNAWKFSEKAPRTVIEFGAAEKNGSRAFFVQDNGVGFDMSYANKLFNPFQRLHKTEEFPGTGIGLATVKRIINRHGGQVWIEAKAGKGATVYFTL